MAQLNHDVLMMGPGRTRDRLLSHVSGPNLFPNELCSIVVPVFNKSNLTERCLLALADTCNDMRTELIIVDNASSDDTRFIFSSRSQIRYISLGWNTGITEAMNIGFALSSGEFITFMHNDLVPLSHSWLRETVVKMKALPNMGATGICCSLHKPRTGPLTGRTIYCLDGMCMTFSRQAFESVGGFDERFRFTGYYDFDICYSLAQAGYETAIAWFQANHLNHSTSETVEFRKSVGKTWQEIVLENKRIFQDKWQISL